MEKHRKKSKTLFFIGIWLVAFGITFHSTLGIQENMLGFSAIPLMIIGIILLMVSNFYKTRGDGA
ncbi:hypothetical protein [Gracilibacillus dipsosauri]|uniref:Uncharacterized protein n=1 Tax=Gracilibacillus dipsosauri TaxID=178340 RepID=A0A317L3F5_9BACI|nr:hypothetical protein [Gracilibacillus dipsosauri]PWU70357.1 hypothetical protein DLJ74_00520 [Gracilibacillus dipsosauri]